jgi:hypothetical protein
MDYQLSITIGSGPIMNVRAEIDFDLSSYQPIPEILKGKLLDLAFDKLVAIKFAQNVKVGLEGRGYIFNPLEKDGTFHLTKG